MKYSVNFLAIVFSATVLLSCGEEKKKEAKIVRPVKYQTVEYYAGNKIRTFSGTSRTDKIIKLSFRSNGIITQFDIKIGQKVRKGQQLAKLDNVQARLNYQDALSKLNSAESAMNTAKLKLDRTRSLYEKGSKALSNLEASKNEYNSAKNSYNSALQSVALQNEQIQYGYLRSPENGVIASVNTEVDENVKSGQLIATLNSGRDMEISLGLPETFINSIKEGMSVDVTFASLAGKKYKGKVSEVAPVVDANTATYLVRVVMMKQADEIKSGMAANVAFDFGNYDKKKRELVVPAHAVGESSIGNFVFLISGKGEVAKIKKQKVTIGELTPEGFEITSGLSQGQRIATAGIQTLLDGQEVKLN